MTPVWPEKTEHLSGADPGFLKRGGILGLGPTSKTKGGGAGGGPT